MKLRLITCILLHVLLINAQEEKIDVRLNPSSRTSVSDGGRLEITCEASSNFYDVEVYLFKDKKKLKEVLYQPRSDINFEDEPGFGRLTYVIDRVSANNAGRYLCRAYVNNKRVYEDSTLDVDVSSTYVPPPPCEFRCNNNRCVSFSDKCNGLNDCGDWSDERECSNLPSFSDGKKCEPTQRTCSDGKTCKEKHWFCDGENDCADGSDEINCPNKRYGNCNSQQFECKNRQQCISKAYVCDKSQDCSDNSDEIGCVLPTVTVPPVRSLEVCVGDTIILNCTAMGFPTPFINWRLNWGHVCDEPRCKMYNDEGNGALVILLAQLADSGAYSCEAINNQGREIYKYDAIVTVKDDCNCDPVGTLRKENNRCICKPGYAGEKCERCAEGYERSPSGTCVLIPTCNLNRAFEVNGQCIECFCNGLDVSCRGAGHLYYNRETELFKFGGHDWKVKQVATNLESTNINTNTREGTFEYLGPSGEWYFHVPAKFHGNRLLSYGGELSFNLYYEGETVIDDSHMKLDVRLQGHEISLVYRHNKLLYPYEEHRIVIPMVESSFRQYPDNNNVPRNLFLSALSHVDMVMIKASFVVEQYSASISDFGFDLAKDCKDPNRRVQKMAYLAEICECSYKYNGTSCEVCNYGFSKSNEGFYLGTCEIDCNIKCNGNSNKCDDKKCYDCTNNTTGDECEHCLPGYFGDATTHKCYKRRPL